MTYHGHIILTHDSNMDIFGCFFFWIIDFMEIYHGHIMKYTFFLWEIMGNIFFINHLYNGIYHS